MRGERIEPLILHLRKQVAKLSKIVKCIDILGVHAQGLLKFSIGQAVLPLRHFGPRQKNSGRQTLRMSLSIFSGQERGFVVIALVERPSALHKFSRSLPKHPRCACQHCAQPHEQRFATNLWVITEAMSLVEAKYL